MLNYDQDNEFKNLAQFVYRNKNILIPTGWRSLGYKYNPKNGFYGEAFYKDGKIAIVYRGTDSIKDFMMSDVPMGLYKYPSQTGDAKKFYYSFKKNKQHYNKIFFIIGHSLGGSLAQIVGSETGEQTRTFNAYGTGILLPKYKDNIINYGNANDGIFMKNVNKQVGNIYIIKNGNTNANLLAES